MKNDAVRYSSITLKIKNARSDGQEHSGRGVNVVLRDLVSVVGLQNYVAKIILTSE